MVFSTNLSGYFCSIAERNTWIAYTTPLFCEFNPASHFALTKMVAVFEVICVFDMCIKIPM